MTVHPYVKNVTFTPTGQTAADLEAIRARKAVRAETLYARGDAVIYTDDLGGQYVAAVRTAHRDGSCTVELQWWVDRLNGKCVAKGAYYGDRHRVDNRRLSSRTAQGTPVGRVYHTSDPRAGA